MATYSETGRLIGSPAMKNITPRTELGTQIVRALFHAAGWTAFAADAARGRRPVGFVGARAGWYEGRWCDLPREEQRRLVQVWMRRRRTSRLVRAERAAGLRP